MQPKKIKKIKKKKKKKREKKKKNDMLEGNYGQQNEIFLPCRRIHE